jgi:hypothetical protein
MVKVYRVYDRKLEEGGGLQAHPAGIRSPAGGHIKEATVDFSERRIQK